jgi:flagellar M-ring protein FliF
VTNYEVDKTVRVTRNATGNVRRLNAAVVVNHRSNTDAKGKTTAVPLTDAEIEKLTALVQQGDRLQQGARRLGAVVNAPFRVEPVPKPADVPLWQQPWVHGPAAQRRRAAGPGLVALMIVFG